MANATMPVTHSAEITDKIDAAILYLKLNANSIDAIVLINDMAISVTIQPKT
jgi:hypothetical protein